MKVRLIFALISSLAFSCQANDINRSFTQPHQQEYGYAAVVSKDGLLYLSGIAAPGKDMAAQVAHVYKILAMTLEAHGSSMSHVLNERVSTTDIAALTKANHIRMSYYPDGHFPASSWYQVDRLFAEDAMIEIEIIASIK